ncbi:hypothetical protein ACFQH6_11010 [Halobacteriaceae archaeon GCM10025711]
MGELLDDETADSIVQTCREVIGDSLRSVTYFTHEDYDQLYLRSDLSRDADVANFVDHEWRGAQLMQETYGESELGDYRYTMRGFENGYLVRVASEREGVFATTDEVTIQNFEEVATALRRFLADRLA